MLEVAADVVYFFLVVGSPALQFPELVFHGHFFLDEGHLAVEQHLVVLTVVDEVAAHVVHGLEVGFVGLLEGPCVLAEEFVPLLHITEPIC